VLKQMSRKRIFISHSSQDNHFAHVLAQELRNRGYEVWVDLYHLLLGRFQPQFEAPLADCQVVLILLSTAALQSTWVSHEIDAALELEKHKEGMLIVPALIEQCTVPLLLSGYHRLYFLPGGDHEVQLDHFTAMLEHKSYQQAPPTAGASPASPWQAEPPMEGAAMHNRGKNIISGPITGRTIRINQGESIVIQNVPTRHTED
jgi:hypothetical protein